MKPAYYYVSGSLFAPLSSFSLDALGMPWEFMEINEFFGNLALEVASQMERQAATGPYLRDEPLQLVAIAKHATVYRRISPSRILSHDFPEIWKKHVGETRVP